jgi:hypothetical protein
MVRWVVGGMAERRVTGVYTHTKDSYTVFSKKWLNFRTL